MCVHVVHKAALFDRRIDRCLDDKASYHGSTQRLLNHVEKWSNHDELTEIFDLSITSFRMTLLITSSSG